MRKIIIAGHLTNDATVYTPQSGNRVAINFGVAVNERFKDQQGNPTSKAFFFSCTYWKEKGKTEISNYLKKGTHVIVVGLPDAQSYKDKDGNIVPQVKVEVKEIEFGGSKPNGNGNNSSNNTNNNQSQNMGIDNEDLPF
jgi:single stranded DNA-binding protein